MKFGEGKRKREREREILLTMWWDGQVLPDSIHNAPCDMTTVRCGLFLFSAWLSVMGRNKNVSFRERGWRGGEQKNGDCMCAVVEDVFIIQVM